MRIFCYNNDRFLTCPACHEPLQWEDGDLQIDNIHPEYYFVDCPICKERMYMMRCKELDINYKKYSKK